MNVRQCLHPSVGLVLSGLVTVTASAGAQVPAAEFDDSARVTAVDLVVELERGPWKTWTTGERHPDGLPRQPLSLRYDGGERPIVGMAPLADEGLLVVYIDLRLVATHDLRRATALLGQAAKALTEVGDVAVIVADPLPTVLLPAGRDAEPLAAQLAQLALTGEGRDELVVLRQQLLDELRHPSGAVDLAELAAFAAAEEGRIVDEQHDRLLSWLVDSHDGGGDAGAGLVLLYVGGAFDPTPTAYYSEVLAELAPDAGPLPSTPAAPPLGTGLGPTLAGYGWTVVAISPPPADDHLPLPGKRIGKLRFRGPAATFEAERDVGRAEAYLELGQALFAQGKLDDAEDAFRRAVHHFYRDPRTAERQAVAYFELGRIRDRLGDRDGARQAYRAATALDPSHRGARLAAGATLRASREPLRRLAEETGGHFTADAAALAEAAEGLGRRVRLTYQVTGRTDGELHPIELTSAASLRLRHASWARAGTPARLSEARLRRLLSGGEAATRGLGLQAAFAAADAGRTGSLELRFEPPEPTIDTARLRVSVAAGGEEGHGPIRHEVFDVGSGAWSYRGVFSPDEDATHLAVVVEDLGRGLWAGRTLLLGDD